MPKIPSKFTSSHKHTTNIISSHLNQNYAMAKRLIILHTLFLFLSINQYSHADELNFHGFKNASNLITLNGAAQIEHNGILKLTNDTSRLVGHAFYAKPIKFKNSKTEKAQSFSTSFVFAIVPEYKKLGGHGLAFAISKSKELNGALPSQYLGLVNASTIGNFSNHVFAVEFDTVQDFEFGDINDNHVGVDFNSLISNASVTASGSVQGNSSQEQEVNLKSGERIQVWIDYDSIKQSLNVSLSVYSTKPSSPILEYPVDLSPIFEEYMYVGFSASTGLLASSHYVFGWSFVMEGQAESLDLSLLPSFPVLKQNHMPVILGVCLSFAAFMVIIIVVSLYLVKKIKNMDVIEPWELDVGPHRFSYKELKQATRCFRDKELIGFGGFGRVYKGKLPHSNTLVAVKRINHESKQGLHEFVSEIASIGRLRHRNLVQLLGWCRRRDDLLLVYDYMPNGSLDKYIFDKPKRVLTWEQRLKIIRDVASGLLYLHEEWEEIVIHRDVKAGNVLLDSEMNGRLGDFGLAKLYEHGENPSTTKVVGTLGYLAPELTKTGKPTTSSDVYAFGALLLEVVCGRRPVEAKAAPEELILVDWVWEKWTDGSILEVLDPRLAGEFDEVEAIVVLKLGLMCSNNDPSKRPNMRQVVRYLHWEVALPEDLATPDEYCAKNVDKVSAIGAASEDFVHSFPSSSNHDKVSTLSSECDGEEDVDLEDGSRLQSSKVMGAVLAGQKT